MSLLPIAIHRAAMRRLLVFAAVALAGCAEVEELVNPATVPESAGRPATDVPAPPAPESEKPSLPPDWKELAARLTLPDVIDIALANNEQTRQSWASARAAAAELGVERAAYWPSIDANATVSTMNQSAVGGRFSFKQSTYGPSGILNWLLFDFGSRESRIEQARRALYAADWQHNAAIQSVVLEVQEAYYAFLAAKALLEASESTVKETQRSLAAARRRHEVGVATIADVLQAQTAASEAELIRHTRRGQIDILRGSLATGMGLPATTKFDVGTLPESLPSTEVAEAAEELIREAVTRRPDLAAARWEAERAAERVRGAAAERWPSISAVASASRTWYAPVTNEPYADNWSASLLARFPLFTGFSRTFEIRKAEAEAALSRSQAASLEQQVVLDVWTSYTDLTTAGQRVKTTTDLLASARQSDRVALGRYRQGAGTILDLLNAQAALALARAQEIQARADWLFAVARLAYATGTLYPPGEANGRPPAPPPASTDQP